MVICVFSGTLRQEAGKDLISIFHCDIDCRDGATHQVKGGKRKIRWKQPYIWTLWQENTWFIWVYRTNQRERIQQRRHYDMIWSDQGKWFLGTILKDTFDSWSPKEHRTMHDEHTHDEAWWWQHHTTGLLVFSWDWGSGSNPNQWRTGFRRRMI